MLWGVEEDLSNGSEVGIDVKSHMSKCFLEDMKGMDLDERGNGQQIKIIDGRRLA